VAVTPGTGTIVIMGEAPTVEAGNVPYGRPHRRYKTRWRQKLLTEDEEILLLLL
jgi:hypothetical protein